MGRMKLSAGLFAIIAASMAIKYEPINRKEKRNINPNPNKNPNMNPNGLTKFIIDGEEVWALNLKNAKRKANKIYN